ncbi:MAG: DUF3267 domain-containing protein [Clostridia bacterium]|nr:DUF3267 domain-containing protein [Clostridia bacterium]
MKCKQSLPEGYCEIYSVNLQKDKKIAVLVNFLALVIAVPLAIIGHFIVPISTLYQFESLKEYILKVCVILGGIVVYMILHELIHGITMKIFGTRKVKYGFTGLYAYAGSDDYYNKKSYIIIALAPIVVWGIIIGIINLLVPDEWFWSVYFIQIANLSGAAGDLFVTFKFLKMPKDILVRDSGIGMTVYSAQSVTKN